MIFIGRHLPNSGVMQAQYEAFTKKTYNFVCVFFFEKEVNRLKRLATFWRLSSN